MGPIPEDYRHAMTVPFTLVFLDQSENEILQDAELFVDRTWKLKQYVGRRGGLRSGEVIPITSAVFWPCLSRGPVPGRTAELLKNRLDEKEAEPKQQVACEQVEKPVR